MGFKVEVPHDHGNQEGSIEYDSEEDNVFYDNIENSQEKILDKTLQRTVHNY